MQFDGLRHSEQKGNLMYNRPPEIARRNPTSILIVVDQSGSMVGNIPDPRTEQPIQKMAFVADVLNKTLQNLIILNANGAEVLDRFWVGVIGYGATVGPAFSGELEGRELVPLSELTMNPARIEERERKEPDGAGGIIKLNVKFPIWFDPKASGETPMCSALMQAQSIMQEWVTEHQQSYPPIVLHLTDGESTDGDPTTIVDSIRSLSTVGGSVMVFNLHVSSRVSQPISFPSSEESLPSDPFAHLLFRLSDPLPPQMVQSAREVVGIDIEDGARGFVFNAGIEEILNFLTIGTQPSNLLLT